MNDLASINAISQVLTLGGATSIRGFPVVFVYFLSKFLINNHQDWQFIPEAIRVQAEHSPEWQMNPFFFGNLGPFGSVGTSGNAGSCYQGVFD